MASPRFSVVIPTRERAGTLRSALATCLGQDFADYEVVVCDNHSSPATREVVDRLASPKVRYHRAPEPLSMADNWNLAYTQARGEYVLFLGDDDGLMPYALRELDAVLRRHGDPAAVRWDWAIYTWPDVTAAGMANYLSVPLLREQRVVESRAVIAEVVSGWTRPEMLPNVYHSLVSRRVLERVRARAGRVFAGWYPDTFSSFAVAALIPRHVSVSVPMTVIGMSGTSNCVAAIFLRNGHEVAREFRSANARAGVRLHPWVPDLPLMCVVLSDSFLQAKAALFPDDDGLTLDRRQLAEQCVADMPAQTPDGQREVMQIIRDSLRDDPGLLAWFDARFADWVPPGPRSGPSIRPSRLGFDGWRLHLDAAGLGITDVAGAVAVTRELVGQPAPPIAYDLPDRAAVLAENLAEERRRVARAEAELAAAKRDGALRYVPRRVARKVLRLVGSVGRRAAGLW